MPIEFSIFGIYLPGALLLVLLLLPVFAVMDVILLRLNIYRWLWHPALCRMAAFASAYAVAYVFLLG